MKHQKYVSEHLYQNLLILSQVEPEKPRMESSSESNAMMEEILCQVILEKSTDSVSVFLVSFKMVKHYAIEIGMIFNFKSFNSISVMRCFYLLNTT